jgi:hypothetical protein
LQVPFAGETSRKPDRNNCLVAVGIELVGSWTPFELMSFRVGRRVELDIRATDYRVGIVQELKVGQNDVGRTYMTVCAQTENSAAIACVIAPTSLALDREAAGCTIETGLRRTIDACVVARRHPAASEIARFLDRIWECGSKAHKEGDG